MWGLAWASFFLDLDAGCQKNNALAFVLKHLDPDMFLNTRMLKRTRI